jgi:hypothetical protein
MTGQHHWKVQYLQGLVALHAGSLCSRAFRRHNYDEADAIVITVI